MRARTFIRLTLCGLLAAMTLPVLGAGFPDKPIKLITPFPPGGVVGNVAFAVATRMSAHLGQPVVLEPRAGAAGSIAASIAAKAPKDGYTLLFGTSSMLGIAKFVNKDLPYDPIADFSPVGIVGNVTVGVFASQLGGLDTLETALAQAKARPGQINFSSPGVGSSSHLAGELFKARARIDIVHVPYPSNTPQMTDLVGGRTQLAFGGVSAGLPYTKDGRTKLIAVAARSRSKAHASVPALGEVFPGYDAPAWLGIVAPRGTPQDVLDRLEAAFQDAMADPQIKSMLELQGMDLDPMSARAFGDKMRREMALWEEAVKAAGLQPSAAK